MKCNTHGSSSTSLVVSSSFAAHSSCFRSSCSRSCSRSPRSPASPRPRWTPRWSPWMPRWTRAVCVRPPSCPFALNRSRPHSTSPHPRAPPPRPARAPYPALSSFTTCAPDARVRRAAAPLGRAGAWSGGRCVPRRVRARTRPSSFVASPFTLTLHFPSSPSLPSHSLCTGQLPERRLRQLPLRHDDELPGHRLLVLAVRRLGPGLLPVHRDPRCVQGRCPDRSQDEVRASGRSPSSSLVDGAESSGNANAMNENTDGSYDVGMWQINSVNWPDWCVVVLPTEEKLW